MADRRFQIEFVVVNAQAKRAREQEMAGYRQVAKEADKSAKAAGAAQAKEAKKAADALVREAKRANAELMKESKKANDAQAMQAKRAADARIRESQRAADAMARDTKRLADIAARDAKRATDAQEREAKRASANSAREAQRRVQEALKFADRAARDQQRAADREAREARRAATSTVKEEERKAKELAAIQDRYLAREYQGRVRYARRLAAEQAKAAKRATPSAGAAGGVDVVGDIAGSLQGLASGTAALGAAEKVVNTFGAAFQGIRDTIRESVASTHEYRDAVLQLADLKDRLGDTTGETKEQLVFRAKTLQGREAAIQLQEGVLNTGQAAVASGRISQAELDALMVKAGSYQAAAGGSPSALGELVGALPSLMKVDKDAAGKVVPLTADKVFAKEQQVANILKKGGSSPQVGLSNLLDTSSLTSAGLFSDISQQAAVQSMYSLKTPNAAGERVQQFARATVGALGKMRGMGVEGGEKQGEYLAKLGVTNQMDAVQIGKVISDDMAAQEKTAKAAGVKFNAFDYLAHHGYGDQEARMALLEFHENYQAGALRPFEDMAAATPDATQANARIAQFQAIDPAAQKLKTNLSADLVAAVKATGPETFADSLKRAAFDRMKADPNAAVSGKLEDYDRAGTLGSNYWMGYKGDIYDEASKMLREQAKKAGVDIEPELERARMVSGSNFLDNPLLGIFDGGLFTSDETRNKALYEAGQKIEAKGVPAISLDKLADKADKQLAALQAIEANTRKAFANNPPQPVKRMPNGARQ